jgi:cellulose synthase/poly-beta-1,6-N-acetylglucosamine synthase-like glycosyltransferase
MPLFGPADALIVLLALFIAYAYLGYPLQLWLQNRIAPKPLQRMHPEVSKASFSVLLPARNEADRIGARIENLLAQELPTTDWEIIVVSDGSDDETGAAVRRIIAQQAALGGPNIELIENERAGGKAHALNQARRKATGEYLVFADARQTFKSNTIAQLLRNFEDPAVGAVSGELRLEGTEATEIDVEMGAYWHYEKFIRRLESNTGSVIGVTGAVYAMRAQLYEPLPIGTILDDLLTPMRIVQKGYRVLFDPQALAIDQFSETMAQERRRKIRTLAGNWQLIRLQPDLFLPWSNPCWGRLLAHKFSRLLVPYAFILTCVLACFSQTAFAWVVLAAVALLVALSMLAQRGLNWRIARLCHALLELNRFAFLAPFHLLGHKNLWT